MRIAIDARYVADHFPGIGRYVYNLLRGLAELNQPHTLAVLYHPTQRNTRHALDALGRYGAIRLMPTPIAPFSLAEQVQVPRLLRALRADCYHAPYYVRPYAGLPCPSVTTLYDIIPRRFPAEATARARLLFDLLHRRAISVSRRIIAISHSARADLLAAYRLPPEHVVVTPLAADARFVPLSHAALAAVRARYGLPEQYVLCVSSNKPHKNLGTLVQAFAKLHDAEPQNRRTVEPQNQVHPRLAHPLTLTPPHLVIAGHWDARYPDARRFVEHLQLGVHVRFLPDVAEDDLPALYGGATMFAYPSRYEGFGLPPLEAMACGVPVLCGDSSSLPEVVGAAALRVNVHNADALQRGMALLLGNGGLRARLREAGLRQAAQFSWRKTAEATLQVYESLV